MGLVVLLPPSLGSARAGARGEVLEQMLNQELGDVRIKIAASYQELEKRAMSGEAEIVWAPASVCARLEPHARAAVSAVVAMLS